MANLNSARQTDRARSERQALNSIIQGSAADVVWKFVSHFRLFTTQIKQAMIKIDEIISQNGGLQCRLLLQIHDELVYEVRDDQVAEFKVVLQHEMENAVELLVPMRVVM
jgi:DNA polymerase I-like protein with 3'-5' exonuclease and polymerase domains